MKHGTLIPTGEKHITEYAFDAVATAEICVYNDKVYLFAILFNHTSLFTVHVHF